MTAALLDLNEINDEDLTLEDQSDMLEIALDYLLSESVFKDEELDWLSKFREGKGTPAEEAKAAKACRRYSRRLKKVGLELPKKWKSTYRLEGMEVWNDTKESGPYTLSWGMAGRVLECDCIAAQHNNHCGHVEFACDYLSPPDLQPVPQLESMLAIPEEAISRPAPVQKSPVALAENPVRITATPASVPAQKDEPVQMTEYELLPGIKASKSQWEARNELIAFCQGHEGQTACLSGFAGTGKTTLIQSIAKQLKRQNPDYSIAFTAVSNKAVRVLAEMAKQAGLEVDCHTCSTLLGLTPDYDEQGKLIFVQSDNGDSLIDGYDLVVIDECSMISINMWNQIIADTTLLTKLIFMGDAYQAPPIDEGLSPSFYATSKTVALTEVLRYSGAIADLVLQSRDRIGEQKVRKAKTAMGKTSNVIVPSSDQWLFHMVQAFKQTEGTKDARNIRAIAYTNRKVGILNRTVHKALYGENASEYVVGMRLIANAHYSEADPITGQSKRLLTNSDEMIITQAIKGRMGNFNVWFLNVQLDDSDKQPVAITVVAKESREAFALKIDALKSRAEWTEAEALANEFADVLPAFAITAHKAQGSTYRSVFVDAKDFLQNTRCFQTKFPGSDQEVIAYERNILLLVAYSRTQKNLFIRYT